jgi:hypothetical protein
MKRWNQKGTVHAKRRMSELRDRKRQLLKFELIAKWQCRTGQRDWWTASGLQMGCGTEASIAWLEAEADKPN